MLYLHITYNQSTRLIDMYNECIEASLRSTTKSHFIQKLKKLFVASDDVMRHKMNASLNLIGGWLVIIRHHLHDYVPTTCK